MAPWPGLGSWTGTGGYAKPRMVQPPLPWVQHAQLAQFSPGQKYDINTASWFCRVCHAPHHNQAKLRCRFCKAERYQQQAD
eukprot:7496145-Alexandrium_andersonii.AAC.1